MNTICIIPKYKFYVECILPKDVKPAAAAAAAAPSSYNLAEFWSEAGTLWGGDTESRSVPFCWGGCWGGGGGAASRGWGGWLEVAGPPGVCPGGLCTAAVAESSIGKKFILVVGTFMYTRLLRLSMSISSTLLSYETEWEQTTEWRDSVPF